MAAGSYNADAIQILEGLEAVRKRPGMYIGSTGPAGLHHLVYEIVDNSVDEYMAGFCTEVKVTIHKDERVTVEDNGRGIPVDIQEQAGVSAERVIFTVLHAGGKFDKKSYTVSGGLHGVGASVVNALSSFLEVTVFKNGLIYQDRYVNGGKAVVELNKGALEPSGRTNKKGTRVTFKPDSEIFPEVHFRAEAIANRLRELSFLNPGLAFVFLDERTGKSQEFRHDQGLRDFIEYSLNGKEALHPTIAFTASKENVDCDVALVYTKGYEENLFSYCNSITTVHGGTHEAGFKSALTRVINGLSREMGLVKAKDEPFKGQDVREGLLVVIAVRVPEPQFEGQTKGALGNTEVHGIVSDLVSSNLELYFDQNPAIFKAIVAKIQIAQQGRLAAKKARDATRIKGTRDKALVVTKLAACTSKDPEKTELYIVEGDSAGGSAKQARDRYFQAVLPLRGKIMNVEKKGLHKLLDNEEIKSLISVLGTGIGEDFDLSRLAYHKIIIMTDADVDGAHIRTLIQTFFFRYMRELILGGHVYIARPPLYKLTYKNEAVYAYNDRELKEIQKKRKGSCTIQRYKGLGEMDPEQLWTTTMDPAPGKRMLKQVSIEDLFEADRVTSVLMSENVAERRKFIESNFAQANLDL